MARGSPEACLHLDSLLYGTVPWQLPVLLTQCALKQSSSNGFTHSIKWRPAQQGSSLTLLCKYLFVLSCPFNPQQTKTPKVSFSLSPIVTSVQTKALTGLWCWASDLLLFPVKPATPLKGSNLLPRREPSTEQQRNNQESIPAAARIDDFTNNFSQICGLSSDSHVQVKGTYPHLTWLILPSLTTSRLEHLECGFHFIVKITEFGHWFQAVFHCHACSVYNFLSREVLTMGVQQVLKSFSDFPMFPLVLFSVCVSVYCSTQKPV